MQAARVSDSNVSAGPSLFGLDAPEGFRYQRDLITIAEERTLLEHIQAVQFSTFEMRGVVARRRVAFFGQSYDARGTTSLPLPDFLTPLRRQLAEWVGVAPQAFAMALLNEYQTGAPIGWHRDTPQYDLVAGVSLLSPCVMKLRPYVSPSAAARAPNRRRLATHEVLLEPRSAYLLSGKSRSHYEHHIPSAGELRYSITFRTLRKSPPI
jgi:alkylated DNA repair dioxygenase AlkB